jgi:colanic acid biosynthesis glycosyl transferase WcaI
LKKIVIHDFSGHPFQFELSTKLVDYFNLFHLYAKDETGPKASFSSNKSVNVKAISLNKPLPKNSPFKRLFWEINYFFKLRNELKSIKPSLVIFSNTPPIILFLIIFSLPKLKWIWWVQDIFSYAALKLSILPKFFRPFAFKIFYFLEKMIAKKALHLICISDSFKKYFKNEKHKISVIENWSISIDNKYTFHTKSNCLIYAGTIGKKHFSRNFTDTIDFFLENGFKFILVSSGIYANKVSSKFNSHKNFYKFDFLSKNKLAEKFKESSMAFFVLEKDALDVSIPSKVYTYIKYELPIFGLINKNHHTAKIIKNNDFGEINNIQSFLKKITNDKWLINYKERVKKYNINYNNIKSKHKPFLEIINKYI